MIWKVFFACSLGTFVLAIWQGIFIGDFKDWSGAQIKFGEIDIKQVNVTHMIPGAIILGIIGGCLGPFFINVNTRVNSWRKKLLKHKWMLPLETAFFCFFTATVFFWAPYYIMREDCISKDVLPNSDD